MLRHILLCSALVAAGGSALAADLPYRTAAPAPYIAAAPIFTWSGFYAGLNAGAAFNNKNGGSISSNGLIAPNDVIYTGTGSNNDAAFTGGAQVGYNMQFGSFVAGVEADINYLGRKRGSNGIFPDPVDATAGFDDRTDFALNRGSNDKWFGTVRGRLGFAFDRALVYGTGGLAFGAHQGGSELIQRDYYEINPGQFLVTDVRSLSSSRSDNKNFGWALGAGFEYALTSSISLKLEYLHVDLGRSSQTFTTLASSGAPPFGPPVGATMTAGNTITIRDRNKFDVVRAGVNYRF